MIYSVHLTTWTLVFFFLAELREIVLVVCGTVVAVLAVIGLFVLYAR